jgi:hypothetical protein
VHAPAMATSAATAPAELRRGRGLGRSPATTPHRRRQCPPPPIDEPWNAPSSFPLGGRGRRGGERGCGAQSVAGRAVPVHWADVWMWVAVCTSGVKIGTIGRRGPRSGPKHGRRRLPRDRLAVNLAAIVRRCQRGPRLR